MTYRPRLPLPLDRDQAAAASAGHHLLVIAGPGAGKTRIIIGRIQHLLEGGSPGGRPVDPAEICCITFTNKAAAEITARVREHFPDAAEVVTVRTFHGLARDIVQQHHALVGLPRHFHVIDEATQQDILSFACRKHQLRRDDLVLRRLKSHLDLEKAALRYPIGHPKADAAATGPLRQLFTGYQRYLHEHGILDFNDLLLTAVEVLLTSPEALRQLHARYRYLLLDEFQDVNQVQYELIRLLAGPDCTVLAVADGNQMIYGWRGSDREYLRRFQADFEAPVLELTRNYRAAPQLQELARHLIAHNAPRHERPPAPAEGDASCATVFHLRDEEEEVRTIERIIKAALQKDPTLHYRDLAVLYRTHGLADRLERDLALAGIPVQRVKKEDAATEEGIGHLVAYLRLSQHLFDWDLYKAMEYPRKLLSPIENLWLNQAHQREGTPLLDLLSGELPAYIAPLSQSKLRRFVRLVRELHGNPEARTPSAYFAHLVESLGIFRSHFTEDEEAGLLPALLAAAATGEAGRTRMQDFLRREPSGRLLLVHNGTATGLLAALMGREGVRETLHRQTALAAAQSLTPETLTRLQSGEPRSPLLCLTFGLTADQAVHTEALVAESGVAAPVLHVAPSLEAVEDFAVAFQTFAWWAQLLAQPLEPYSAEAVIFDLETTSVQPMRCHVLEIAAQRIELATGAVRETFESLVRPPVAVPPVITELTGIRDADVADAPPLPRVLPRFLTFLGEAPVLGHNLTGYDLPVLRRFLPLFGDEQLENLPLDTLPWSRELLPRQRHSLSALAEHFQLTLPEGMRPHRALADVEMVRQLWPKLVELDQMRRGLLYSQRALILLALATYQEGVAPDPLRQALREGARRLLQYQETDDRDIALLLGRHFDEFTAARLLALVKQLRTEPLGDDQRRDRFEQQVAALRAQILQFEEAHPNEGLGAFLTFHYLLSDQDVLSTEDTVKLLTVHAAKGLEFEIVIVLGMEQGTFPHHLALRNVYRIEEERRLLYVALTRARRKVYFTALQTRAGRWRQESMFLRELPRKLVRVLRSDKTVRKASKVG